MWRKTELNLLNFCFVITENARYRMGLITSLLLLFILLFFFYSFFVTFVAQNIKHTIQKKTIKIRVFVWAKLQIENCSSIWLALNWSFSHPNKFTFLSILWLFFFFLLFDFCFCQNDVFVVVVNKIWHHQFRNLSDRIKLRATLNARHNWFLSFFLVKLNF